MVCSWEAGQNFPGEPGCGVGGGGAGTGGLKEEGGGMGTLGHRVSWKEAGHPSESEPLPQNLRFRLRDAPGLRHHLLAL